MKERIPYLIHQIYEGRDGSFPSRFLLELAKTWIDLNPNFEYVFWDYRRIDAFLEKFYPSFMKIYKKFELDVQRWDAIRYLILYHYGGVYADLDYECLEPLGSLLEGKTCCFSMDPPEHWKIFKKEYIISNAFMATVPNNPFFKKILERISFIPPLENQDQFNYVLETTGPYMLNELYVSCPVKESVHLIPYELISPLSKSEISMVIKGSITKEMEQKVEQAYAIHYFLGSWY